MSPKQAFAVLSEKVMHQILDPISVCSHPLLCLSYLSQITIPSAASLLLYDQSDHSNHLHLRRPKYLSWQMNDQELEALAGKTWKVLLKALLIDVETLAHPIQARRKSSC